MEKLNFYRIDLAVLATDCIFYALFAIIRQYLTVLTHFILRAKREVSSMCMEFSAFCKASNNNLWSKS